MITIETLFDRLEKYYGEYENQNVKNLVKNYLVKDHKQDKYDEIIRAVLYFHQARFGSPCIATIEDCLKKARYEKGTTDTHKTKTTDTSVYDYSLDPEVQKGQKIDLKGMLKNAVKKVE